MTFRGINKMHTSIFFKEISMYGTRKYLNKGNLAAILFYANYIVKNPKFSLVTGPVVFSIPNLC